MLDPEVVVHLLNARRHRDALADLTPREREVLALLAEGRSNAAIAHLLVISLKVVEKHVASIFVKFGLAPSDVDNRRVLAAIRYLRGSSRGPQYRCQVAVSQPIVSQMVRITAPTDRRSSSSAWAAAAFSSGNRA